MQYRKMGKWGVRLSAIGLGSYLTIGFKLDEQTSRETVRAAYEAGINFFDTANAYNSGEAERVLGKCLAEFPRSSLFVITKVFAPMGEGPNDRGLSKKHIFEQCEASLKRLGMDYVDLYMCHRPDPDTPLEETVRAMEDLARQGKIGAVKKGRDWWIDVEVFTAYLNTMLQSEDGRAGPKPAQEETS